VVQDGFKTFSNVSKKRNLDFKLNIPPSSDSISLNTDPVRLRQILGNLIGNAVKFTERGYIEIGYDIRDNGMGSNIRFFVKDSGIGIPKDKQTLIFERFRQLDDTSTRRFGGTGLGLSISKKLVDLLGGAIWVESQPGEGSEFYFTIPYKKEKNLPPVEPETFSFAKYNWKNKTLLIAEDENSNFELIKASISKTGIRIIRAMNGEEALDIARANDDIDLILMDIRMPKMNGYDATRNIKSIKPDLPIIAITAYAMSEDEEKSLEAGCDRYISKPIRPARLLELIDEYIS
jgi:CheY-like chemotaxis protein